MCGASVYFYSNSAGSKVYFDALGPPWPKHPCMDAPKVPSPWDPVRRWTLTSEAQPSPSVHSGIGNNADMAADFHDQRRYEAFSVLDIRQRRGSTRLLLQFGGARGPWATWLTSENISVLPGDTVFLGPRSGQYEALSYLDRNHLAAIGIWVQQARTSHSDHRRARKRLSR